MSEIRHRQKLIVTIVKKDHAKKVVQASKKAGAQGGTTLLGRGVKASERRKLLGIPIEREREIVLTLVPDGILSDVLQAINDAVKLDKPNHGIGFVVDTQKISGICHRIDVSVEGREKGEKGGSQSMDKQEIQYDLIVTIVKKGDSDLVVDASKEAGAEGGTILSGRGTGIHEQAKLFNILIEPEKEIVLTLISRDKTADVLQAIEDKAALNQPGKGIAFVLEVEKTIGINHILNKMVNEKFS